MIITQPDRTTQHYTTLLDYQKNAQAIAQPSQRRLLTLASYISDSERKATYLLTLAQRTCNYPQAWSPQRADVTSDLFDPIKAILYLNNKDTGEALWLAFLLIHTGDSAQSDWQYLKQLYGNHGKTPLTWASISTQLDAIEDWIAQNSQSKTRFKFGKHRKYESTKQLYQVVQSYQHWISDIGGIDALTTSDDDPKTRFASLYQGLQIYRFGRLAKFEFLSLLGYLGVLNVSADHCYLKDASGPKRGAKLLFGAYRHDDELDKLAVELADELGVDYAVFEAALCHWQVSPDYAIGAMKPHNYL